MQLVLLIPVLGLLLIAGRWTSVLYQLAGDEQTVIAQATRDTERLAGAFEQHTVRTLRDADRTLQLLKYEFERTGNIDVSALIAKGLIPPDPLATISLRDRNGKLLPVRRVRDGVEAAADIDDRVSFDTHAARDSGKLHIDKLPEGAVATAPLRLSRRVDDAHGAFAGVVEIALDPDAFTDVYAEADLGDHGILGLLGSDGAYRARRTGKDVATTLPRLVNSTLLSHMQRSPSGVFDAVSSVDKIARLVAYRRLADYPLTVVAAKATDEVLAGYQQRRATYLTLTSSATVVLLLFFALITALVIRVKRNESALDAQKQSLEYAQSKLEQLANVDALTGLPNRRLFSDRMEQARRRARRLGHRFGLLFIDLNGFKKVNDDHGHVAGDALLNEVARRLQACLRGHDSVCRLGGDEFTVIMEDATLPPDAIAVAERITKALDTPVELDGELVQCHASIGIALYPDHGQDTETLLKSADLAMYRAKHAGVRRYAMAGDTTQAAADPKLKVA